MNTLGGRMRRMAMGCALALAAASLHAGTTYYVATNGNDTWAGTSWATAYATISNALAKTKQNVGDVVLVSNGTYVLSAPLPKVDYGVTVRGLSRKETIVDGSNAVQCFSYVYGTVDNLSVTRGRMSYGSALYMLTGSQAIGLNVYSNTAINGNTIYMVSGTVIVSNCFIHGNTAGSAGASGIAINNPVNALIVDCIISNNVSTNGNGGITMAGDSAQYSASIRDCTVVDNVATGGPASDSAGIYVAYDAVKTFHVSVIRCVIANNIGGKRPTGTGYGGGGINLGSSTGRVDNCLIYGNTADYGGGITVRKTNEVVNCTIVSNTAAKNYGGIYKSSGEARVRNSIVFYNGPDMQGGVNSFDYCCLTTTNGLAGEGNITNAPGCVAPASRDWRLASGSPCMDHGNTESWMTDALDVARYPRLDRFIGRVDMGAYEYQPAGVLFKVR